MHDHWDQFDEALNDALASYGEAPVNDGLERRVLARISETAGQTHPMKPLAVAICAAALVMPCLFWLLPKIAIQTKPANTTLLASRKVEVPGIRRIPEPEPPGAPAGAAARRRMPKRKAEPKLPRFPTPSPMSSDERALIQLVNRNPKDIPSELTSFAAPIKPIQITAIEIKPL
jgi:hypothetical protein